VYAAAHQLLHPALVGFCFACWVLPTGRALAVAGLYSLFAACAFLAFDVGRKLLTPQQEREGYETYSAMYGMRPATWLGIVLLAGAALALAAMLWLLNGSLWTYPAVGVAWLAGAWGFLAFLRAPDARRASKLKDSASLTMLLGFVLVIVDLCVRHGLSFTGHW